MSRSLRIVVADDDADILDYYVRMIPHLGHVLLDHVNDGIELVESCLRQRPDVALSDVQMRQLDGISAMHRVQEQAGIPFIFISADDEQNHHSEIDRGLVLDYLRKPIKRKQLAAALQAAARQVSA